MDKRIGASFLHAGIGFGGFCFPKDLEAFYWISKSKGYDFSLLRAVKEVNEDQKSWIIRKAEEELWNLGGKTVALLGLAFKPDTDDMLKCLGVLRETTNSPNHEQDDELILRAVGEELQKLGAQVRIIEPRLLSEIDPSDWDVVIPMAAAACDATLSTIIDENLVENSRVVGEYLLKQLKNLQNKYSFIGDVRGRGLMIGVEMVADRKTKEPLGKEITRALFDECLKRGLMTMSKEVKQSLSPNTAPLTAPASRVLPLPIGPANINTSGLLF